MLDLLVHPRRRRRLQLPSRLSQFSLEFSYCVTSFMILVSLTELMRARIFDLFALVWRQQSGTFRNLNGGGHVESSKQELKAEELGSAEHVGLNQIQWKTVPCRTIKTF